MTADNPNYMNEPVNIIVIKNLLNNLKCKN